MEIAIKLDDFISQEELRALSDRYKRIAGCRIEDLAIGSAGAASFVSAGESTNCEQFPVASQGWRRPRPAAAPTIV